METISRSRWDDKPWIGEGGGSGSTLTIAADVDGPEGLEVLARADVKCPDTCRFRDGPSSSAEESPSPSARRDRFGGPDR